MAEVGSFNTFIQENGGEATTPNTDLLREYSDQLQEERIRRAATLGMTLVELHAASPEEIADKISQNN